MWPRQLLNLAASKLLNFDALLVFPSTSFVALLRVSLTKHRVSPRLRTAFKIK